MYNIKRASVGRGRFTATLQLAQAKLEIRGRENAEQNLHNTSGRRNLDLDHNHAAKDGQRE